ncbi:MAG: hypothetical protein JW829_07865 [Pirellulales bacterium]|nr:hypothetical protein [Pirellulales bacterium]
MSRSLVVVLLALSPLVSSGCRSPYYADQGALFGGLTGAGLGALVGNKVGDTGAGAAIGAGVGALTGAVAGQALDDIQAENRAAIAAQLGREVQAGAATIDEVIAMSRSGVDPSLIKTYIQNSGMIAPLSAADVIHLHEQGVATDVIQAMQTPRPATVRTATLPSTPVIIEERHYNCGPPPFYPHPHFYYRRYGHRPPHFGWGFSISN